MKQNTPGRNAAQGVVYQLGGDTDAYHTITARVHFLVRLGVPSHRACLIADLALGSAR